MNRRTFFASFLALVGVKSVPKPKFHRVVYRWKPKLTAAKMNVFPFSDHARNIHMQKMHILKSISANRIAGNREAVRRGYKIYQELDDMWDAGL